MSEQHIMSKQADPSSAPCRAPCLGDRYPIYRARAAAAELFLGRA
jgi:hypothetical protein